ncbi:MAG: glycosyltransferase family 2 protein [Bacteroidales bacterium]|jgi:hypothetical protein|nr:glycosyltransferase family 2 protein [Bacteroidales bacterium]
MKLHIAIPAMQELDYLPETLDCIAMQFTNIPFHVYICVNQPDIWWDDSEKLSVCEENQTLLKALSDERRFPLTVLDRASKGCGWRGKQKGVGYARKVLFDHIISLAGDRDIIISLDADTTFNINYFDAIRKMFEKFPDHVGMIVPYYHRLTGNEIIDRAILRYEIYMRCYVLNFWRIGSPYNFTALGSAMAIPVWALRAVGGIAPYSSGEDFYLAQKLRKYGNLILFSPETVHPSSRLSNRVAFGTGPAMIKGVRDVWDSYPIYPPELFDPIKETFESFPELFERDISTPMDCFLHTLFPNQEIWAPLRKNFKDKEKFIRACHQKIDGLRTLQFLKASKIETGDNENLVKSMALFFEENIDFFDFKTSPIEILNAVRNILFEKENELQRKSMKM